MGGCPTSKSISFEDGAAGKRRVRAGVHHLRVVGRRGGEHEELGWACLDGDIGLGGDLFEPRGFGEFAESLGVLVEGSGQGGGVTRTDGPGGDTLVHEAPEGRGVVNRTADEEIQERGVDAAFGTAELAGHCRPDAVGFVTV